MRQLAQHLDALRLAQGCRAVVTTQTWQHICMAHRLRTLSLGSDSESDVHGLLDMPPEISQLTNLQELAIEAIWSPTVVHPGFAFSVQLSLLPALTRMDSQCAAGCSLHVIANVGSLRKLFLNNVASSMSMHLSMSGLSSLTGLTLRNAELTGNPLALADLNLSSLQVACMNDVVYPESHSFYWAIGQLIGLTKLHMSHCQAEMDDMPTDAVTALMALTRLR